MTNFDETFTNYPWFDTANRGGLTSAVCEPVPRPAEYTSDKAVIASFFNNPDDTSTEDNKFYCGFGEPFNVVCDESIYMTKIMCFCEE